MSDRCAKRTSMSGGHARGSERREHKRAAGPLLLAGKGPLPPPFFRGLAVHRGRIVIPRCGVGHIVFAQRPDRRGRRVRHAGPVGRGGVDLVGHGAEAVGLARRNRSGDARAGVFPVVPSATAAAPAAAPLAAMFAAFAVKRLTVLGMLAIPWPSCWPVCGVPDSPWAFGGKRCFGAGVLRKAA